MKSVLVVDDKELMRGSVSATLERAGFTVRAAEDGERALTAIAQQRPDAVVTDMRMPGMTGMELINRIRCIDDDLPIVMMTAFGTIDTAVAAVRAGAFDYLTKPFEGDELVITLKRAIEHRRVCTENAVLRMQSADATRATASVPVAGGTRMGVDRLMGDSDAMKALRDEVVTIAQSMGTVLITGESGVGKEVVSRVIHECSPRGSGAEGAGGPFLAVNCAALSESLLESELFGHERGAFTGAERQRKGRFELADRGTLLLDEISEVSPSIQAKLLRVLQERAFERVGSSITIGVDVRVVGTSNRDLPASVAKGEFRQDLYFRLNVLPIRVPSLRERRADIGPLAEHFIRAVALREGRGEIGIESRTVETMKDYAWPGNVRELQNICERAVVLSGPKGSRGVVRHDLVESWLGKPQVRLDEHSNRGEGASGGGRNQGLKSRTLAGAELDGSRPSTDNARESESYTLGLGQAHGSGTPGLHQAGGQLEAVERAAILGTLARLGGHRQKTAAALGIGVRTLGLKLKKWKELGLVAA